MAKPLSCFRSHRQVSVQNCTGGGRMEDVVVDTNVFVAAGFNPTSASARILEGVREGRFRLIWNRPTRRETEMILRRIPRLDWRKVADPFRPENEVMGPVDPAAFTL